MPFVTLSMFSTSRVYLVRSLDISGPYPKLSSSALRTSPFIPSDQEVASLETKLVPKYNLQIPLG